MKKSISERITRYRVPRSNGNYIENLAAPSDAYYRELATRDTFGHLIPDEEREYVGTVVFCCSEYNSCESLVISTDFKDLSSSPWFFNHVNDFVERKTTDHKHAGKVLKFTGTYKMLKNGKGRFKGKIHVVKIK